MREDGFALFNGEREEDAGGQDGEDAGDGGGEGDPEERVQGAGMLARAVDAASPYFFTISVCIGASNAITRFCNRYGTPCFSNAL